MRWSPRSLPPGSPLGCSSTSRPPGRPLSGRCRWRGRGSPFCRARRCGNRGSSPEGRFGRRLSRRGSVSDRLARRSVFWPRFRGASRLDRGKLDSIVSNRAGQAGSGTVSAARAAVRFTEISHEAGVDFRHLNGASADKHLVETIGSGGLFFDYDDDGWIDIFLVDGGLLADPARAASAPPSISKPW
jgi:hypothetical protein